MTQSLFQKSWLYCINYFSHFIQLQAEVSPTFLVNDLSVQLENFLEDVFENSK